MSVTDVIPTAIHRGETDLPFVDVGDGTHLQVLQIDVEKGLWVIRTRFEPGVTVPRHKHTGEVFAFTIAGSWRVPRVPRDQPGRVLSVRTGRARSTRCTCPRTAKA